jgi:hypothetical protein
LVAAAAVVGLTVAVKFAEELVTATAAAAADGAEEGDGTALPGSRRLARGTACDAICPPRHTHRSFGKSPRAYHASSCARPSNHRMRVPSGGSVCMCGVLHGKELNSTLPWILLVSSGKSLCRKGSGTPHSEEGGNSTRRWIVV